MQRNFLCLANEFDEIGDHVGAILAKQCQIERFGARLFGDDEKQKMKIISTLKI